MNEKPQTDRLHVFISSRMQELEDLRAHLHRELKKISIDAFVYEVELGARPDDPETVSLLQVERTDIFVLVIGRSYGEITEREYDRARELNKPCLVYERLGRSTTDEKLQRFIDKLSGPRGVPSRSTFQNAVDLAEKVAKDVHEWLVREYQRLSVERSASPESSRVVHLERMKNFTSITDSDFNREVTESYRPVLVYFWAEWCKECQPLMQTVQTVSAEMGARIKIVLLNVDENPRMTRLHCIEMVPTLILFISGEERERIQGLTNRAHLFSTIDMQLQDKPDSHSDLGKQPGSKEKDLVENQRVEQDVMQNKDKPVRDTVFISYSRRDARWLEMVKTHLKPFERDGRIKRWDDTEIKSGQLWKTEIDKAIGSARVVVLLVSPEFLASDFIANNELPPLLVAAETDGATILSVIIRACNYAHAENISKYQAINPPEKPLAKMSSARRDEVLSKLTERILEVLKSS